MSWLRRHGETLSASMIWIGIAFEGLFIMLTESRNYELSLMPYCWLALGVIVVGLVWQIALYLRRD